jgi:hypothetical protein
MLRSTDKTTTSRQTTAKIPSSRRCWITSSLSVTMEPLCSITSSSCEANPGPRRGSSGTLALSFQELDAFKYAGSVKMSVPLFVRHHSACHVHVTDEYSTGTPPSSHSWPILKSVAFSNLKTSFTGNIHRSLLFIHAPGRTFAASPQLPPSTSYSHTQRHDPPRLAAAQFSWTSTQTSGVRYPMSTPPNLSSSLKSGILRRIHIPSKKAEEWLLHLLAIRNSCPSELHTKDIQLRTSIVMELVLLWFSRPETNFSYLHVYYGNLSHIASANLSSAKPRFIRVSDGSGVEINKETLGRE